MELYSASLRMVVIYRVYTRSMGNAKFTSLACMLDSRTQTPLHPRQPFQRHVRVVKCGTFPAILWLDSDGIRSHDALSPIPIEYKCLFSRMIFSHIHSVQKTTYLLQAWAMVMHFSIGLNLAMALNSAMNFKHPALRMATSE